MYIKKLQTWKQKDWDIFFLQFPNICELGKEEVQEVLQSQTKAYIEKHFYILRKYGVINGIGPGYAGKFFRKIITLLFRGVRYEWHDIMYAIGGNELDRRKADYGLWKYSIEGMHEGFWKIWTLQAGNIELVLYSVIYLVFLPLRIGIAGFCYIMVLLFGKYGSFRFLK